MNSPFSRSRLLVGLIVAGLVACRDAATLTSPLRPSGPQKTAYVAPGTTADVPASSTTVPTYVTEATVGVLANAPVIRVYQDEQPWFGLDAAHLTLVAAVPAGLGKALGHDYFIHPLSDLSSGIPAGTAAVVLTSNSFGDASQATTQNSPSAQAALSAYLAAGGVVVIDMGDNLSSGGFIAPGSTGTPTLDFPSVPDDASLLAAAASHPIVLGPDGVVGGGDDLTDTNIDGCCFVAHGNLEDGLVLPAHATPIMTAWFGTPKIIMAEYCVGAGRVILDTNTKEFAGQQPVGPQPKLVMRNLFSYALSPAALCIIPVSIDIKPESRTNPLNVNTRGLLPVAILTTAAFNAALVDAATVTLGDGAGTETRVAARSPGTIHATLVDVDGDRDLDLLLKFSVPALVANGDLGAATTSLTINGRTTGGVPIRGSDLVRIVPP